MQIDLLTDAIDAYRDNTQTNVLSISVNKALTEAFANNTAAILENNEERKADLSKLESEIKGLQNTKRLLEEKFHKAERATTYIRWGREDCPGDTTDLVYSGYVSGSHYTHKGAAVDFVCLPKDPSWGPKAGRPEHSAGFMYGVEYEDTVIYNVPDRNREVPCAVCRKTSHSTTIMIPARTTCYPGWEEAYHGYLSSGYHDHPAATQYVCVDENPHTVVGGANTDDNGILFYAVRTRCGSLKCPPYENDKVLSCVVCLK